MIKRIVCFLSAVIVMTSSVFAWDAYSFTGVYDVASSAPVLVLDDSSTASHLDFSTGVVSNDISVTLFATGTSHVIPGYDPITTPFSAGQITNIPVSYSTYLDYHNYMSTNTTLHYDSSAWQDVSYDYFLYTGFDVTFTIPVPSDAGAFECDFNFINFNSQQLYPDWGPDVKPTCNLYFGDTLIDSWVVKDGRVLTDSQLYSFSSSSIPSSIRFVISVPSYSTSTGIPPDESSSGERNCCTYVYWSPESTFDYWFLSPDGALIANVGEAQDDINNHESIESQWTGSMSSNFDALDMDSFTFPSGLLSGFSLITGIFQDLWNGMGDYKILYVFPLFLGIALLLIGRISKFSGGQSSSRSNRGDDDA